MYVSRTIASPSWQEFYRERANPRLATKLLRDAVPALAWTDWRVVETAEGYARSVMPLNRASTNQHGTHQAALIVLAADYTGGSALATLVRAPVLGVNPQRSDEDGAVMWLAHVDIGYVGPSTADLTLTARISPDRWESIRNRFESGAQSLERVEVVIESAGEQVARSTLTYYLISSRTLRPRKPGGKISRLFQHRVKASARLSAGIRALESSSVRPMFRDVYSAGMAGEHGKLLAQRYIEATPKLKDMVAARTKHIDDLVSREVANGTRQVVFVGVGLDVRAMRLFGETPDVRLFEIDLPPMLAEREKALAALGAAPPVPRTTIGMNIELEYVAERLLSCDFDPASPSVFIFEGMSMYFDDAANRRILGSIQQLLGNPRSVMWVDIVAKSVIDGTSGYREADEFLRGMERLGEPFIFGLDDAPAFFSEQGLCVVDDVSSGVYRNGREDFTFDLYRFYVLSRIV